MQLSDPEDLHLISINQIKLRRASSESYRIHAPINITSDSDFVTQGYNGSGTIEDPYRIEGLNITSNSSQLIRIRDTTAYFWIKSNILDGLGNSSNAISLFNVSNGLIEDNLMINHTLNAISLYLSDSHTIVNNTICNNTAMGIKLVISKNNNIINNTIYNNKLEGIYFLTSENNSIKSNDIRENLGCGIKLIELTNNTTIMNNNIEKNKKYGIHVENAYIISEPEATSGTEIINNTINNNGNDGLKIYNAHDNIIMHNIISNNQRSGIWVDTARRNQLIDNEITENSNIGIYLNNGGENIIKNNKITNNEEEGILDISAYADNITDNIISDNINHGISLENSRTTSILSNTITYNGGYGLIITEAFLIEIKYNTFIGNNPGEEYQVNAENADECTITDNNWDDRSQIEGYTRRNNNYNGSQFPEIYDSLSRILLAIIIISALAITVYRHKGR
jgi:parallel beta-helix repeat protein